MLLIRDAISVILAEIDGSDHGACPRILIFKMRGNPAHRASHRQDT